MSQPIIITFGDEGGRTVAINASQITVITQGNTAGRTIIGTSDGNRITVGATFDAVISKIQEAVKKAG